MRENRAVLDVVTVASEALPRMFMDGIAPPSSGSKHHNERDSRTPPVTRTDMDSHRHGGQVGGQNARPAECDKWNSIRQGVPGGRAADTRRRMDTVRRGDTALGV
jgi:hypothetical protein